MAERETVEERIARIFSEEGIDEGLNPQARLKEELGLDSLALIRLVFSLNSEFNIEISGREIIPENFATVTSLEKFISSKLETNR